MKGRSKIDRIQGGGARRDRTADLLHAMQALSQLSYSPTKSPQTLMVKNRKVKFDVQFS